MNDRIRCRRGDRAFTLIELMIVVAIIAILISILLPSLAKAREQAKSVTCGSHLKEIFNGVFMYAQDNGGALPNFGENFIIRDGRPFGFWSQQIRRYVPNAQVYLCPSDLTPVWEYIDDEVLNHNGDNVVPGRSAPGKPARFTTSTGSRRRGGGDSPSQSAGPMIAPNSYIGNCNTWSKQGARDEPRNINHFKFPAFFVMLTEGDRGGGGSFETRSRCFEFVKDLCGQGATPSAAMTNNYGFTRHNGGSNYLFLDGHVEPLKPNSAALYCERIEFVDFAERRPSDRSAAGGGGTTRRR